MASRTGVIGGGAGKNPRGKLPNLRNPMAVAFFFLVVERHRHNFYCREEVVEKHRFYRFGENGRWTRSYLIRWGKTKFSYRVVHQGALSGSSGPARAAELSGSCSGTVAQ